MRCHASGSELEEATYKCGRCGKEFERTQLELLPGIRCPYCGYRVIYKVRRIGVKKVKAV